MGKIIKTVLGGLGISVVLAALFPSAFLKNDAQWTYQSDFGRVDVAFAGDVRNGQIEGKNCAWIDRSGCATAMVTKELSCSFPPLI